MSLVLKVGLLGHPVIQLIEILAATYWLLGQAWLSVLGQKFSLSGWNAWWKWLRLEQLLKNYMAFTVQSLRCFWGCLTTFLQESKLCWWKHTVVFLSVPRRTLFHAAWWLLAEFVNRFCSRPTCFTITLLFLSRRWSLFTSLFHSLLSHLDCFLRFASSFPSLYKLGHRTEEVALCCQIPLSIPLPWPKVELICLQSRQWSFFSL